jgi:hypothetical protein
VTDDDSENFSENALRRVDVELFIVHPTISPGEISAALGLDGHFVHCGGDLRRTPKGTLLEGRYQDTRWRHSIRYDLEDQWFAEKITKFVDSLVPHKQFLHSVRATGGTAEIIIQFLGGGYFGDSLPLDALAKMTELQLSFGIECYNLPQS